MLKDLIANKDIEIEIMNDFDSLDTDTQDRLVACLNISSEMSTDGLILLSGFIGSQIIEQQMKGGE